MRRAFVLLLLGATMAAGQPSPVGVELQVSSSTSADQAFPAVAVTAGGFVVVWESYQQDGSYEGVFAQRFASSGAALGGELQVSTYTSDAQRFPGVASDSDGNFVVVWESLAQDLSGRGVFARRFDASGSFLGDEVQINTWTADHQEAPAVAVAGDGSFVVVWQSSEQDGYGHGVFGQRFDSSGAPKAAEFQVNTFTEYDQSAPAVAADGSGGFVVVWESYYQDGSSSGIFAQRFDPDGMRVGAEMPINTETADTQSAPTIAEADNGTFVVVWASYGQGIFGRLLDSSGQPTGSEFQVNATMTGAQFYPYPRVAAGPNGDFLVVWAGYTSDPTDREVVGRHFGDPTTPLGGEVQINTFTAMTQTSPAVARNADGQLVVVWHSLEQDGQGYGVFGQRFGASGAVTIDVDANGAVAALSDALLILRYAFGLRDAALVAAAVAPNCTRCEADPIEAFIAGALASLDVDGNGTVAALTDALLILRYVFGLRGAPLVAAAVAPNCTRCEATPIEAHIDALVP